MAETANIAKMAELLSTDLFAEFHWTRTGSMNINWQCEDANHHRNTHPSDVVFHYDEPYVAARTYVNCDLKSYARGSITSAGMRAAVESLALSLACAEKSDEWQRLYVNTRFTPAICGLLFVYNHDGEYDRDFAGIMREINVSTLRVPKGSKLVVFGPDRIWWLDNVKNDILQMRGRGHLPSKDKCRFFYPDLVRRKLVQHQHAKAATLEMLTSPWIMLEYLQDDGQTRHGVDVYYRGPCESEDEFTYLIDWVLHYNIVRNDAVVRIKTLASDRLASTYFERAKEHYIGNFAGNGAAEMTKRLKVITYQQIATVKTQFSDINIGMGYD